VLEAILQGMSNVVSPTFFLWIFLGTIIGLSVGILPGLGGAATLAILLPLVYKMDPVLGMAFLLSVHSVVFTGGLVTTILFGIPGESTTIATLFDGFPMGKKGQAGQAMGAGFMASILGGIFGAFWMAALIPVARPIVLAFGSPEIFMLALLGISFVAVLGRGSVIKALISASFGLMLSFVGFHTTTGILRYTFGNLYLYEGLKIVPVAMGIFAVAEAIDLMRTGTTIAKVKAHAVKIGEVIEGVRDSFRHWWLVIRCSAIGTTLGLIPGVGAGVAQMLAYAHGKQTSKRSSEFGTGCVEGVIAPEAADNAKEGGSLLTALSFGIPSGVGMVMVLAALMMLGIDPGPEMFTKHLDMVWTLVFTLIIANVIAGGIGILTSRDLARVSFLRESILSPIILLLVILGAYAFHTNIWDVLTSFIFGGIGYLMKSFGYSRLTLTMGFVLGIYAERYFLISTAALGPGFLLVSPIAAFLAVVTIFGLASGGLRVLFQRLRGRARKGG